MRELPQAAIRLDWNCDSEAVSRSSTITCATAIFDLTFSPHVFDEDEIEKMEAAGADCASETNLDNHDSSRQETTT